MTFTDDSINPSDFKASWSKEKGFQKAEDENFLQLNFLHCAKNVFYQPYEEEQKAQVILKCDICVHLCLICFMRYLWQMKVKRATFTAP